MVSQISHHSRSTNHGQVLFHCSTMVCRRKRRWTSMYRYHFVVTSISFAHQIERLLPVANEDEQREFSYVLSKKTYHSISDGHLWLSIFSRPPSIRFTRVQRCTCCFVLLFSSMLLNIMYYGLSAEAKSSNSTQANSLSLGPFYISAQQVCSLS